MLNEITRIELCHTSQLLKAWKHVKQNKGAAGTDNQTVAKFEKHLNFNISQLKANILRSNYYPKPLRICWMKKPSGGLRKLAIPSVSDRLVQTSAYLMLSELLDSEFEHASWGYRPGRSIYHALAEIQLAYQDGFRWLVDADIEQFFDNIPHQPLLELLTGYGLEKGVLRLIRLWLRVPVIDKGISYCQTMGVPQGSPLSPLLSNLYLDKFDERFLSNDFRLIRYADDFVILAKSERSARNAYQITEQTLNDLQLNLNKDKTAIRHFDEGFEFLGAQIEGEIIELNPNQRKVYKSIAEQAIATQPITTLSIPTKDQENTNHFRRTLYLNKQGSVVNKQGLRLMVKHQGEIIANVPAHKLDMVSLYGNVHLTTPVIRFLLSQRISVILHSQNGNWEGEITSLPSHGHSIQQSQFTATEQMRLSIAKAIIHTKIQNSIAVLRRYNQRRKIPEVKHNLSALATHRDAIKHTKTNQQLLGHEGISARYYFTSWQQLLDKNWQFTKRIKRPAPDPVNALLSLGYSILYQNVKSVLLAVGFQPLQGVLHVPAAGHSALASDVMEELRPIVVDSLVLSLCINNKFELSQFSIENGQCIISKATKKTFIALVERNLQRNFRYKNGQVVSLRYAIELQCRHLARVLQQEDPQYIPLKIK